MTVEELKDKPEPELVKNEVLTCDCGNKYHVSVFPVWQEMKNRIRFLESVIDALRNVIRIDRD